MEIACLLSLVLLFAFREKLKQIAKILLNIHAMDHSMQLASEYSFKLQLL